jgi:serine/threonine protein kinase
MSEAFLSDFRDIRIMYLPPSSQTDLFDLMMSTFLEESHLKSMVLDVASGLADATMLNITHRDVKTENIGLYRDSRANQAAFKLLDLGLAAQGQAGNKGGEAEVKGTFGYIAPEMCRNDSGRWNR